MGTRVCMGKHNPGNDLRLGLSLWGLGWSPLTKPGWSGTCWGIVLDETECAGRVVVALSPPFSLPSPPCPGNSPESSNSHWLRTWMAFRWVSTWAGPRRAEAWDWGYARSTRGREAGGGAQLGGYCLSTRGCKSWELEEQTLTVMKLENSKTGLVLEEKKEEGWRQDPLLKQSCRTQGLIGNVD